jgi:dTDP-4-amino-4,6-dideoxygalactose transaminase
MKAEMDQAILNVAASGAYIMGPQVAELEQQLAAYVDMKHCISCANGTDALWLALRALGLKAGDAVFVPDFTFFSTAEAPAILDLVPVFVDVDEKSFNMDAADLERKWQQALNNGLSPAAVIAVDLFGRPADYDAIVDFCRSKRLPLIEDGAQGFGGSIRGKRACSFGDISTTSFFPAKPLGCYGDGGALFTNDDRYADLLRSLRVHGKGTDKYDNVRLGLNSRLDTLQAAILQVKLRHFDDELKAVNRVAAKYNSLLSGKVIIPEIPSGIVSSWAQYTLQTENRDDLQARLKAAGVPAMVYYPHTMSRQTAFAHLNQAPCPVADELSRIVLSLPMHPYMTDEEIETVASLI